MRRRWLERAVIAVAAFASIATSRKKWSIKADIPQADDGRARIVVIESSRPVYVSATGPAGHSSTLQPEGPKGRYLVPANTRAYVEAVGDTCKGGCNDPCDVPPDEYLRIASVTPIAVWHVEVPVGHYQVKLTPERGTWQHVELHHNYPNVELHVEATPLQPDSIGADHTVFWPDVKSPQTVEWTGKLIVEGPCADAQPCEPPADASDMAITEVKDDGYDHHKAE